MKHTHRSSAPLQRFARTATAIAAACLAGAPAWAQTAATKDEEPQTLNTIVVTAQKREQALIDVPASVTALSADRLTRSGYSRLEDYAAQVPGMSITALTRGYTSVVLRGISTGIAQATPSTAYYIDEAPIGSINAYAAGSTLTPDLDPYDLRRVEVLKGPQGTLYGAGAVGGLLRYVTVPPDTKRFGGQISLGGNSVSGGGNGSEGRASLNIPVSGSAALRVSVLDRTDAGYIDNPTLGQTEINKSTLRGGRVALGVALAPDWSLLVSGQQQKFRSGGSGAELLTMPSYTPVTKELERGTALEEPQKIERNVFNATLKGQAAGFSIVSSTTYQTVKAETTIDQSRSLGTLFSAVLGIPNVGIFTKQLIDTKRWSQELRARNTAMGDKLEYEVGLFYTKEDNRNSLPPLDPFNTATHAAMPLGLPIANALIASKYEEYSLFANLGYALTPNFDVLAGVRQSHTKQNYHQDYKRALLTSVPVLIDQDVSNNKSTMMLGARYKPARDMAVYARVATGYRPGGPSALPPDVVPGGKQDFQPDTLTSYELGFKSALGPMASIEAAVFHTNWKDIQIQTSVNSPTKGLFNYFVNGGAAKADGAEATLLVYPTTGLSLRATIAYTDSHLTEDAPAAGGLAGDRMPFVPKVTTSLGADYRFNAMGRAAWVGAAWTHLDQRRSNFSNKSPQNVPGYSVLGINGGIDIDRFRVTLYGKNIANTRGINYMNGVGLAGATNPLANPYAVGVIQPRTVGLDVAYQF